MCAFGTLTCGEMGIGPKSPLLLPPKPPPPLIPVPEVVAFRIIESAVVDDALLYDVDSEGDTALALLL